MAAHGKVTIVWDGGEHEFSIAKLEHLLALEDKCKAGIALIMHRVQQGVFFVNDVRETVRLGLIGGGMEAGEALRLVKLHVDAKPLMKSAFIANEILTALMAGPPEDDPVGKQAADLATDGASTTPTGGSADPSSTGSARP